MALKSHFQAFAESCSLFSQSLLELWHELLHQVVKELVWVWLSLLSWVSDTRPFYGVLSDARPFYGVLSDARPFYEA